MSILGFVAGATMMAGAAAVGAVVGVVTYREHTEEVEAVVGPYIDKGLEEIALAKAKIAEAKLKAKTVVAKA